MRPLLSALIYAALLLGANPVAALDAETRQTIIDMRVGDMRNFIIHKEPQTPVTTKFTDIDGNEYSFADSNGKYRLVSLWAVWCVPCRKEMPSLDALQRQMGGDDFLVIAIATTKNRLSGIHRFYEKAEITDLPILLDPDKDLAAAMGAKGLPVAVFLDPEGQEIARLTGGADWNSENAIAILQALMAAK